MSWKDILKMMISREFMTEVIRHIGGGQIDDGSLKKLEEKHIPEIDHDKVLK